MPRVFTEKSKDWRVSAMAQAGIGMGPAVFTGVFDFSSNSVNHHELFTFSGFGLGIGGNFTGSTITPVWAQIPCSKEFSLADLHKSFGRLGTVAASKGAGYGALTITAFDRSSSYLFEECLLHGPAMGKGLGTGYMVGLWESVKYGSTSKEDIYKVETGKSTTEND